MAIKVVLTPAEIKNATEAGKERNRINREANKKSVIVVGDSVKSDINGARAELAVSKAFGLEWTGRIFTNAEWKKWEQAGGRDVGCVEVRSSVYSHAHLPGFEKDKPQYPYVLVTIQSDSEYTIVGWAYGHEFQKKEFWRDPARSGKPYFCYPQNKLRSTESLKELISKEGGEFKNDKNTSK